MLTYIEMCRSIADARYDIARKGGSSNASVIVLISHQAFMELMSDKAIPLFPYTGKCTDISIMGARIIRSNDLQPGEVKFVVAL